VTIPDQWAQYVLAPEMGIPGGLHSEDWRWEGTTATECYLLVFL